MTTTTAFLPRACTGMETISGAGKGIRGWLIRARGMTKEWRWGLVWWGGWREEEREARVCIGGAYVGLVIQMDFRTRTALSEAASSQVRKPAGPQARKLTNSQRALSYNPLLKYMSLRVPLVPIPKSPLPPPHPVP